MNYSQNTRPVHSLDIEEQSFALTKDAGLDSENRNLVESTSNLNDENFRNKQNYSGVGNIALNTTKNDSEDQSTNLPQTSYAINLPLPNPEKAPSSAPNLSVNPVFDPYAKMEETKTESKLGEITDLNTPIFINDSRPNEPGQNAENDNAPKHFTEEKITKEDLAYLKSLEDKLNQDDNVDGFYDVIQNIRLEKNAGTDSRKDTK